MWWVLVGSVLGLVASSLMIVYWFSRLRLAIAEKGWKYTSIVVALPWIIGLFTSINVLMRELTVIQKGGTVDTALMYTLAILWWIVLATVGTGIILDAAKRRPNLQHSKLYLLAVYIATSIGSHPPDKPIRFDTLPFGVILVLLGVGIGKQIRKLSQR